MLFYRNSQVSSKFIWNIVVAHWPDFFLSNMKTFYTALKVPISLQFVTVNLQRKPLKVYHWILLFRFLRGSTRERSTTINWYTKLIFPWGWLGFQQGRIAKSLIFNGPRKRSCSIWIIYELGNRNSCNHDYHQLVLHMMPAMTQTAL